MILKISFIHSKIENSFGFTLRPMCGVEGDGSTISAAFRTAAGVLGGTAGGTFLADTAYSGSSFLSGLLR
jgi:hypothetical protein